MNIREKQEQDQDRETACVYFFGDLADWLQRKTKTNTWNQKLTKADVPVASKFVWGQ